MAILALFIGTSCSRAFFAPSVRTDSAAGPLRVHPTNPRYFTDGSGRVVYLTGSHERNNFATFTPGWNGDPLLSFDFNAYLNMLERHNHNFIRLWAWEGIPSAPYERTGPGTASDGGPKYNLDQFDLGNLTSPQINSPHYFERLRARVMAARARGIYISIMLFQGWSIQQLGRSNAWLTHPFNANNNIQGVNGDLDGNGQGQETHTLLDQGIIARQEAYIRQVIDTINDLDNVLYEISNEEKSWSADWQYHMIDYIHSYEAGKPKQHPVGMTCFYDTQNSLLWKSRAEWISPGDEEDVDYSSNPPPGTGAKVVIADIDHLGPSSTHTAWVWKSFVRGLNPILLDIAINYPHRFPTDGRAAMGHTRRYADRINLAAMTPRGDLTSTSYGLADPENEYLIYQPVAGTGFTVNLGAGTYTYEWFDPSAGSVAATSTIAVGGGNQAFTPPFNREAVLYLRRVGGHTISPRVSITSPTKDATVSGRSPRAGSRRMAQVQLKTDGAI
jgi:hypothetical protein